MNTRAQGRFLVIRGGAIGDFILTLPVLTALRARFPEARLDLMGYPHIARLAEAGGLADAVHGIDARPMAGFFSRSGVLDPGLSRVFGETDLVLSFLYDPDGLFEGNVRRVSKAQFIAGPHRPDVHAGMHATKVFLKPLERLAIFDGDPVPRLALKAPIDSGINSARRLAVHPGSGSEAKNWPEESWRKFLVTIVRDTDWRVLMVVGEAEGEKGGRLAAGLPADRVEVMQGRPLTDVAMKLASCGFFIGHDSGITHLASAVGLSGAVLWGESSEAVWGPASDRFQVLRDPGGIAAIEVERVLSVLA